MTLSLSLSIYVAFLAMFSVEGGLELEERQK
jgi:hypothetical protein